MQNIQVISEKILNGPIKQGHNPILQMDSGFLELLATLTQNSESKFVGLPMFQDAKKTENGDLIESKFVELPMIQDSKDTENVEVTEDILQKALVHFWVSNGAPPILENLQISNEASLKIENVLKSIQLNQNQMIETNQNENRLSTNELPFIKEFELKTNEQNGLLVEKLVIETEDTHEIQKHFKVLSQPLKLKEVIKKEELSNVNQSIKPQFEELINKDLKLTSSQMNEFKQSIEEMQAVIEQMSKKNDQTIIFKLKPEGLAEIVIKFEQKLGKVVLDISTSNRMVEQLIQKELPNLRDSLKSLQMEVNLNEMSFKHHSDQSQQPKYYQERQVVRFVEEEINEDSIVLVPQSYGFNTYV